MWCLNYISMLGLLQIISIYRSITTNFPTVLAANLQELPEPPVLFIVFYLFTPPPPFLNPPSIFWFRAVFFSVTAGDRGHFRFHKRHQKHIFAFVIRSTVN